MEVNGSPDLDLSHHSRRQPLHCEFNCTIYKNFLFKVSIDDYHSDNRSETSLYDILDYISQYYKQPVYLCGEVECRDGDTVTVPLVCKENWEEFIRCSPDADDVTVQLQVKKLGTIKTHSLAIFDCFHLTSFIQRNKKIDELDIWGRIMDYSEVKDLCDKIFYFGYQIREGMKATLWKNMLGVYHPTLATQADRQIYFTKLRCVYEKLKKKWVEQKHDRSVRRLYDMVKRDAERTDITIEFYSGPANQNVRKLINIIVTYVREHPNVSYTQGMTDMLSPLLYVLNDEADAYICFSCMLLHVQDNFTPQCQGALQKIEALKHVCEVLAPHLYHYLQELDQDAFTLCFGMVLIECRREFCFKDSINLFEVIIASRFGYRIMTQSVSQVVWANYMTTISMDVIEEMLTSDRISSSIAHSVNSNYTEDSYRISPASCTSQPKDTSGYRVTRSQSVTPQPRLSTYRSHDPSGESRSSTRAGEVVHSLEKTGTPQPPESGLDSSTEGDALTAYPVRHYHSSSDDGITPVRFFDRPHDTALELSSGRSSRASSLQLSSRMELAHDLTQTSFEVSFPVFISLAILLTHQYQILHEQVDFIGISGLLGDNIGHLELWRCLRDAQWLKQRYHFLQQQRFGFKHIAFSKWLTEDVSEPHNNHIQ